MGIVCITAVVALIIQEAQDDGEIDDWSQIKNTAGLNIDDYEPRCRKCHLIYDDNKPPLQYKSREKSEK